MLIERLKTYNKVNPRGVFQNKRFSVYCLFKTLICIGYLKHHSIYYSQRSSAYSLLNALKRIL